MGRRLSLLDQRHYDCFTAKQNLGERPSRHGALPPEARSPVVQRNVAVVGHDPAMSTLLRDCLAIGKIYEWPLMSADL
jgi:hypothetical protein